MPLTQSQCLPCLTLKPLSALIPRQQRCDAPRGNTAVEPLGVPSVNFEILLAITLRRQVFRWNLKLIGKDDRHRLGAPVGKCQVVVI